MHVFWSNTRVWYGLLFTSIASILAWLHLILIAQPDVDHLKLSAHDVWALLIGWIIGVLIWLRLLLTHWHKKETKEN